MGMAPPRNRTGHSTYALHKYSMATIQELESFKMSDAVKFHNKLNPNLWINSKLDPEVRDQLIIIANDFVTSLGLNDLQIKDVTVSGSNAAYSYTPHSDLDLHVLVDMAKLRDDDVYRELFTAKKTLYNDSHDITVHGVPVELYVQDVNEPVKSLGEYSVLHDKWIRIPKKQRANFDQAATKAKFDNLVEIVELALKTKDLDKVEKAIATIKRYRKAGLDKAGEFGPENLAFKAIRKQGGIQELYDLRDKLRSAKLSIEEAGMDEDYDPNGRPPGPEFKPTMPAGTVRVDVSDVYDWYKLGQHISNLDQTDPSIFGKGPPSTIMAFGDEDTEHNYINNLKKLGLSTTDIDPFDPNQPKGMPRQKVDPTYNVNEAPRTFQPQVTPLEQLVQDYGYLTTFGMTHLEKQGKTPEAQQALLSLVQRLSKDGKTFANIDKKKMEANRDAILNHIHSMMQYAIPVLKKHLPADKWEEKRSQINAVLTAYNNARQINEASGYIPSAKEKNDPRFKTALTVDVKPDAIKKNAKAFGFKTSRAGIPPQARADGKIAESLMNEWKAFLAEDEEQQELFPGYDEQHKQKRMDDWLQKTHAWDGHKPMVFYHATTKDFDTFNTHGTGFASALGMAFEVERHGSFFAVDPKFAESFIEKPDSPGEYKEGGRVLPVHLSVQNPIDLRDNNLSYMLRDEETVDGFKANDIDLNSIYNYISEYERWELFDGPEGAEFVENLQKLGFDGAIIVEMVPNDNNAKSGEVWVVFNPNQVKSINNRGSFSPTDPGLMKENG